MNKTLVTGSSGHLGEALVRKLIEMGLEVTSIDILPSQFTSRVGSILDREFIRSCMTGIDTICHTATLHKPHILTHSARQFIDTNVCGTLNLLEEAVHAGVNRFVYTSTTSTFGDSLIPPIDAPAAWINELITPLPKNIYGVTKASAEDICQLFSRNHALNCIILKTSRFFPEQDDDKNMRDEFSVENSKVNELLFRRVDIEDVVSAHLKASEKVGSLGFNKFIISATTPFNEEDLKLLRSNAPEVVKKIFPDFESVYKKLGWKMIRTIDRVYVNEKARKSLDWEPKYDFRHALDQLKQGKSFQSPQAHIIGSKGYHR